MRVCPRDGRARDASPFARGVDCSRKVEGLPELPPRHLCDEPTAYLAMMCGCWYRRSSEAQLFVWISRRWNPILAWQFWAYGDAI